VTRLVYRMVNWTPNSRSDLELNSDKHDNRPAGKLKVR
jgi:hypothetical protein